MRLFLALFVLLVPQWLHAETIIISLSAHSLKIRPNFDGSAIVAFGSIERDAATVSRAGTYGVALSVRGPQTTFVVREKRRTLGLWVNRDSEALTERPAFYFAAISKGLLGNVDAAVLKREKIGLDSLISTDKAPAIAFENALIRANKRSGLYSENQTGITFLTPTLFRATIPVPSNTPIGDYEVRVHLFSGGALLGRTATNFEVTKAGFEAFVATVSQQHGLFYGIIAVLLALGTGWFASVIFRRD